MSAENDANSINAANINEHAVRLLLLKGLIFPPVKELPS